MKSQVLELPIDDDGTKTITTRFRVLAMKVADGQADLFPFIYHVHKHNRGEQVLGWLVRERLVGKELSEWIGFHVGNKKPLTALAHLIRRMDNDAELRPIIAGKDYRV